MEQKEICDEFVFGFCPNKEFFIDKITKECANSHDIASINEKDIGIEKVYTSYYKIISEIDFNIELRKKLLKEKVNERENKMLNMLNTLHLSIKDDISVEKYNKILYYCAILIFRIEKNKESQTNVVCEVCGKIYKKSLESCDGDEFHEKYIKLRGLYFKIKDLFEQGN